MNGDIDYTSSLDGPEAAQAAGYLRQWATLPMNASEASIARLVRKSNMPMLDFAFISLGKALHRTAMAVVVKGTYADPKVRSHAAGHSC